ncbi:hypothetical protein [Nonomuraea sp. NPDC050786]|uniref:hypothetical protein n=1 Tax=Nonomuraea sp. NPDC050786 TaxID=3154840 RepID=UPI0033C91F22
MERALNKGLEHRKRAADAKQHTTASEIKSAIGMFQHQWRDVAPDNMVDWAIRHFAAPDVTMWLDMAQGLRP